MSEYVRPHLNLADFRDDEGNIIDYGNRWGNLGGPPDYSYSVLDHHERFAPLHTIAEALIDYFVSNFDVTIEEGYHVAAELRGAPKADEVVRAVCIAPNSDLGAPLVFVLTSHPSARLFGGVFFIGSYPSCGCNACDEEWASSAEQLETDALSITTGGLTEQVGKPKLPKLSFYRGGEIIIGMGQTVSYALTTHGGTQIGIRGGEMRAKDITAQTLDQDRKKLSALATVNPDGNWQAWQSRA